MINRYIIPAVLLIAAPVAITVAAESRSDKSVELIQKALALLESGNENAAQQAAMPAANAGGEQGARAWLIIATARYRLGELESAIEAYDLCRKTSSSKTIRDYAFDRALTVRKEIRTRLKPETGEIPQDAAKRLAKVEQVFHFASAPNIFVRARNPELARVIASRAQILLEKAWYGLGAEIKYPHQIRIFVHADRHEYAAAAPPSPDWSCATARVDNIDGKLIPRIDLTQLDENGQFDSRLLDRILPHELCHLAVSEYFGPDRCPLFLTEGLAMMAEKAGDPSRQILAGQSFMADDATGINDLVSQEMPLRKPELFYSLSYSLVEFLHSRMSSAQFKAFLNHIRTGCPFSHAVQRAMGISYEEGFIALLAETWKKHSMQQSALLQAVQQAVQSAGKPDKPDAGKP
ncbi:MAG: hypothetical protein HZA50_15895 [Planctomycetes bacterium]|nr:hypothetical protein [Planctomycetota bacterium]